MPTKYETNQSHYFSSEADPKLRAYFGRVRKGSDREYRTNFFEGSSIDQILAEWSSELESIRREWPTLWEFEMDLAKKVGPMSIMKPLKDRMKDIDHYYEDILLSSKPISHSAIAATMREWGVVQPLRIRSQSRTVELMKKSTNSGSPFFTKRRTVCDRTFPAEIVMNTPEVVQTLPDGNYLSCAVLGWRGQEGGPTFDDVKQRVVWMFPFAVNAAELQLYQVLIEGAQRYNLVPAWTSMESVDRRITQMFDSKSDRDLVICTDFSKFDQHFNAQCQDAAAEMIHTLFRTDQNIENWLHDVFPIKYMIPLMYDLNKVRRGSHGMGSGSGGTNADETLVHRALQYEAAINSHSRLNIHSQCLGDDGVLTFPGITVDAVLDSYTSHGLEMNPDKQYVSTDDCTYLRRWHHKGYRENGVCVGVYSTCRALGRLAERERGLRMWNDELETLRQLSILENIKYHPMKEEFVTYCMKGSTTRLGLDIPGFFDRLDRIVIEATDLMPDFLGYVRSEMSEQPGINSWWIVNYLKSKR